MLASELAEFLRKAVNSVSREAVLTKRVLYDLELAAAARGIPLQVFIPQVDREGFDVIVDDGDEMKRIQLKTVLAPAGTASWDIHRRLLRPGFRVCERLGYEPSQTGTGLEGGLLVIECEAKEAAIEVRYLYTDVWLLTAFELGVISCGSAVQEASATLHQQLGEEPSGKVSVPRRVLLTAKSPEHLLALMGLHSRVERPMWWHLLTIAEDNFMQPVPEERLPEPLSLLREDVAKSIGELVSESVVP